MHAVMYWVNERTQSVNVFQNQECSKRKLTCLYFYICAWLILRVSLFVIFDWLTTNGDQIRHRASFKNLSVVRPSRERDPTKRWWTGKVGTCLAQNNFVLLSVWGLIFGIFRHNLLYISSVRQRFGHRNTKILFLTKLFFPFLLIF
jgi:hypothetical protein